jgi:hypothetical protein
MQPIPGRPGWERGACLREDATGTGKGQKAAGPPALQLLVTYRGLRARLPIARKGKLRPAADGASPRSGTLLSFCVTQGHRGTDLSPEALTGLEWASRGAAMLSGLQASRKVARESRERRGGQSELKLLSAPGGGAPGEGLRRPPLPARPRERGAGSAR